MSHKAYLWIKMEVAAGERIIQALTLVKPFYGIRLEAPLPARRQNEEDPPNNLH
jgi:hypothetical protein